MPSVFLTRLNSSKPIPSFEQKGISDQMPGMVGDVAVYVNSSLFNFPRTMFRLILHCLFRNIVIQSAQTIYDNLFKPITHLPIAFEVPVCTFRFKNLSDSEEAEIKAMGLQQDIGNKNHFVGMPGVHQLARIHQIGPVTDRLRPGQVNYEGFFAYCYLMKGVLMATTALGSIKQNGYNTFIHSRNAINKGDTGSLTTVNGEASSFTSAADGVWGSSSGIIQLIPPSSPVVAGGSYLDVSRLPTDDSTGIFFPYFNGMNTQDKDTAFEVFQRIFTTTLGPTFEIDTKLLAKVRSGCRELSFHRTGIILAHIYRVIDIALQVPDAKIHVVLQGTTYVGTAIEADFEMTMYHKVFRSGPLLAEMKKVNQLRVQAEKLCEIFNSAVDGNGAKVYSFIPDNFLSSRAALSSFRSVSQSWFHSSDLYDQAKGILRAMEFNDVFSVPSQSMISTAVSYMLSGDESLLKSYPAYLGSTVLSDTSRTSIALSIFGPRVPSCNVGDGKGTNIAFPGEGKNDTNLVREDGIRPLAYFPFWLVPIQDGINQWNKLISSGVLSIPKGRKGKKEFTDLHRVAFSVSSDPAFTGMYNGIKQMVNEARAAGNATGKRKRGMDEGDNVGKKARFDESSFL